MKTIQDYKNPYDGRDLHIHDAWIDQQTFKLGYHYNMRPEFAVKGLNMLEKQDIQDPPPFNYPDLRTITIK